MTQSTQSLQCPHGKPVLENWDEGLRRFIHREDGSSCGLLNRMDLGCEEIARAHILSALEGPWDEPALRRAYAAYKLSAPTRFFYLERICALPSPRFQEAVEPILLALKSEDTLATEGLYLMELYFAFSGICERISAANEALTQIPLYHFLGERGTARVMPAENPHTREYAAWLREHFRGYENRFTLPAITAKIPPAPSPQIP